MNSALTMRNVLHDGVIMRRLLCAVSLAMLPCDSAAAQSGAPVTPVTPASRSDASRLDASRSDLAAAVSSHVAADPALRELLIAAPARGVPAEPLLTKVREGIAKGSDGARIREAVRVLSTRLDTAARALAPSYSPSELTAGAGALQIGVSPAVLRDLRRVWVDKPLTVPLGVLTEMVIDGVPLKLASSRLRELMQRGATGAQLVTLGTSIREDVAAGYAPGTALELRAKGVFSLLANPFKSSIGPATTPVRPRR